MRVFWLDRAATLERLRAATNHLAAGHPEIEKIVLFGSLARGDAVPGSDADLLLILKRSDLPFLERSAHYSPPDVGISVDVFAYTVEELDRMIADDNRFVAQALREGLMLFERGT